jgi:hypothetical protein
LFFVSLMTALTFAAAAQAAGGTGQIGAFNESDGGGEYEARVSAQFTPDESEWPWAVTAYTVPLGSDCIPNPERTVLVSDSVTGPGSIVDVLSLDPEEDASATVCLYASYRNQQYFLTQADFTPPAPSAPSRPRRERIPTLSAGQAWGYVATVLDRRFSDSWSHRAGGWIKCGRINRTRMRCRVAWAIGDSSYSGLVRIWRERDHNGKPQAYFSYRLRGLDEYCAATGGSNCTRLYTTG